MRKLIFKNSPSKKQVFSEKLLKWKSLLEASSEEEAALYFFEQMDGNLSSLLMKENSTSGQILGWRGGGL